MHIINDSEARMRARNELEAAGCDVVGIDGEKNALQIHIARGKIGDVCARATAIGARCDIARAFYFPIGGDHERDEMRHDGSYPGSRGFRLHALVLFPRETAAAAAELNPAGATK